MSIVPPGNTYMAPPKDYRPSIPAMMYTDKMEWEKRESSDITCPYRFIAYRLSRMK
jgi:hypothetical protein